MKKPYWVQLIERIGKRNFWTHKGRAFKFKVNTELPIKIIYKGIGKPFEVKIIK